MHYATGLCRPFYTFASIFVYQLKYALALSLKKVSIITFGKGLIQHLLGQKKRGSENWGQAPIFYNITISDNYLHHQGTIKVDSTVLGLFLFVFSLKQFYLDLLYTLRNSIPNCFQYSHNIKGESHISFKKSPYNTLQSLFKK